MSHHTPRTLRLAVWNTFLLPGLGPGDRGWLGSRLASRRADEIGRALAGSYDVAALSEVWRPRDRQRLRRAWADAGHGPDVVAGLDGPGDLLRRGSGLATLVDGPRLDRHDRIAYRSRERAHRGIDAWPRKGAVACAVEAPGGGLLEVVSTHLAIGGWLDPGPDHRKGRAVRRRQLAELVEFADAFHREPATLLVVGDLNVVAGTDEYRDLCSMMGEVGLVDWWPMLGAGHGVTCGHGSWPDGARADAGDPRFCADLDGDVPAGSAAARIDYVFGPPPASGDLVPVRLRRRRFAWPDAPATPRGEPRHDLSDHLALHLELEAR